MQNGLMPEWMSFYLQVLYKVLEYDSSFNWKKYGISLSGLIALEKLPEIVGKHYVLIPFYPLSLTFCRGINDTIR